MIGTCRTCRRRHDDTADCDSCTRRADLVDLYDEDLEAVNEILAAGE
jgi:hypothetical protein